MSYIPTNWKAGDTVTSAKLNKMEQGIANVGGANILVAHCTMNEGGSSVPGELRVASSSSGSVPNVTLDVTLRQIMNADFTIVQISNGEEDIAYNCITGIHYYSEDSYYGIHMGNITFYAESEDDYPATDTGSDSDDSGDTPIYT